METQNIIPHKHNVKFKVSLSNGETYYEGKAPFEEIVNQPSPWQRLIRYTIDKKCTITSLALYTDSGQTFNLPSLGKNPKFKEFATLKEKPIDFQVSRKIATEMDVVKTEAGYNTSNRKVAEWYTVAEAIYPSYSLQLWVDEQDTKNCWVLVV